MGWPRWLFGRHAEDDALLRLRLRLTRLRHLLWTERAFLDVLTDLSEKLWGDFVLDRQFVISGVERASQEALRLAYDCGVLCGDTTAPNFVRLDELKRSITDYLTAWPLSHRGPLVVPMDDDGYRVVEVGEPARDMVRVLRRGLASSPDGFIITCQGLLELLDANELTHLLKPSPSAGRHDWDAAYAVLARAIPQAAVPPSLSKAVNEARKRWIGVDGEARTEPNGPMSPHPEIVLWVSPMRSTSGREFPLLRAVTPESSLWKAALDAWARFYADARLARISARSRSPLLAALVVQGRRAGGQAVSVRTVDPECPDSPAVLVQPLVAGSQEVPWERPSELAGSGQRLSRDAFLSTDAFTSASTGASAPGATALQAARREVVTRSLAVERLTHRAVEAAWQIDERGQTHLLELRRLDAAVASPQGEACASSGNGAVLQGRGHICGGASYGPVVRAVDAAGLAAFPDGGVLVAPRWSADCEAVMARAAALVLGAPPPFRAIQQIRSLGIPTIIGLARAIEIPAGTMVTVDAEEERVHRGRLEALCVGHLLSGSRLEDEPEYQILEGVLRSLGNPEDVGLARPPSPPGSHLTLLDEVLAIHGRAMTAMIALPRPKGSALTATMLGLGTRFRVPVWFVDLESGEPRDRSGRKDERLVAADQIASAPWSAFWEGLSSEIESTTLTSLPAADRPLLITTKRSVHLAGGTADARYLLSARLTSVAELNHLYGCWLSVPDATPRVEEEIRCFGRSETETTERLRELGRRRGLRVFLGDGRGVRGPEESDHG